MLRAKTKELFAVKGMLAGLINPSVNDHLIFPEVAERAEFFFAGEEIDSHFKEYWIQFCGSNTYAEASSMDVPGKRKC